MNGLNEGFYFVVDKLASIYGYFNTIARSIGYVVLLIAVCTAAVNYALTGTGLKENFIKILKAVVFFFIVMAGYPAIITWMTTHTLSWGQGSTYTPNMSRVVNGTRAAIADSADQAAANNVRGTYAQTVTRSDRISDINDPSAYFGSLTGTTPNGKSTVAPAALLQVILLTAGECIKASTPEKEGWMPEFPDFGLIILCLFCAFFIIVVGIFALLEYLVAYLEFMFISSVGIILFPLSLWDGSKFMAEKLISALTGFFIKLLFCTVCIFLAIYGYSKLALQFTEKPFTGTADEVVIIVFSCLLFFYLCKSAPGLAQSLMTGSPTLNAAGAVGAAASAVGAAAGVAGLAARTAVGTGAAMTKAGGAYAGASEKAGGGLSGFAAGLGAAGKSVGNTAASYGGDLTRSLMARPLFGSVGGGGGGGGGGAGGHNRYNEAQAWLQSRNPDGSRKTIGEFYKDEYNAGRETGAASVQGVPSGQIGNVTPIPKYNAGRETGAASVQGVPNGQIGNVTPIPERQPDKVEGTA